MPEIYNTSVDADTIEGTSTENLPIGAKNKYTYALGPSFLNIFMAQSKVPLYL